MNSFRDLGASAGNATAIWFHQRWGSADRFVGFMQDTGKGMRHFWEQMLEFQAEHGFRWGVHHLPHDGKANLQGAELTNRIEILESLGQETADQVRGFKPGQVVGVPRTTDLKLAIELTQRKMTESVFIDEEGCKEGIRALDNYQYEWVEALGTYSRNPLHNWASNPADAFRQWAQGYEPAGPHTVREAPESSSSGNYVRGAY